MEIIHQLGINGTVFIQFAIFICTFLFLNLYVFKPYYAAVEAREKSTTGAEDMATEILKKTTELHSEYEIRAREVSQKIKEIYEQQKGIASKECDAIVGKARTEATTMLEQNNRQISQAVQAAAAVLKSETSSVALAITHKLLGK